MPIWSTPAALWGPFERPHRAALPFRRFAVVSFGEMYVNDMNVGCDNFFIVQLFSVELQFAKPHKCTTAT